MRFAPVPAQWGETKPVPGGVPPGRRQYSREIRQSDCPALHLIVMKTKQHSAAKGSTEAKVFCGEEHDHLHTAERLTYTTTEASPWKKIRQAVR